MSVRRVAIIGTGSIAGGSHVPALRELTDRVALVAAVDVDAGRVEDFCARHDIAGAYTDVGEMLERERPDLVAVCTPPATHAELCAQAMEAGAWVLCEKPLCVSLEELDRIQAVEARTGARCASVFQWRFGSGARHLKRLLESGDMGAPLVALCLTTWFRPQAYYDVEWRGRWATEGGGATMGHGIHAIDLMLWLLGDWREVRGKVATLDRRIEVEDVSMGIVEFDSRALASVVSSVLSPREESYLRVDLQKATVELRHLYRYANADWSYSIARGSGYDDDLRRWQTIEHDQPSSHAAQLAAVLEAIDHDEPPPVGGADARRTLELIASLYKAADTGGPVPQGSIGRGDPFYGTMGGGGPHG